MNQPRILLGVTGSVAAKLTPKLVAALQEIGEVQVVATKAARYFWDPAQTGAHLWTDEQEWPGERYVKDQPVPHIALGDWADLLVIAPLTANTATKLALGIADNLLTCLYYAWPDDKPVLIAPAMNTRMWLNDLTRQHWQTIIMVKNVVIALPVSKPLACGTVGIGAMADIADIAAKGRTLLSIG